MTTKICTKCGKEQPIGRFSLRSRDNIQTRRSICKDCTNAYLKEYKKGYTLSADPVDATPADKTNVAQPNRINIWALPVYKEPTWGR